VTSPPDEILIGLLEAAPDAILAVDRSGAIVVANAAAERLFGYTRTELIGQRVEVLVPHRFRAAHPRRRTDYLHDPVPRPMGGAGVPLAALRKDGTEFPAEISLSSLRAGDLVVTAVRDVTERVDTEQLYRGLLDSAPDAIVVVDESGRIVLVNTQAERLFGYRRSELVGEMIEMLVPDGSRARHPQMRRRYTDAPESRPMGAGLALGARRKDGTEFPAEISLSALPTGNGLVVSAAIRDVTDRLAEQAAQRRFEIQREQVTAAAQRQHLEAQLHQSQRLESLGQLAGGVAHDFNNLLAVMLNYTQMALDELDGGPGTGRDPAREQMCQDLRQVVRAGGRASELTHQLLAFGRREVVQPRVLDLNTVITEVEQLLLRTLGEHIQLHVELAPDLWPVLADPGQIEQVLLNLAVNARDAMPHGGTLTVHTGNHVVDGDGSKSVPPAAPGRYVRLRVADTGTGIPADVLERVFEPFYTTKAPGEGTGLGLATVYGIVTQAGGNAVIQSSPGAGTAFIAVLPATSDQPACTVTSRPAQTIRPRPADGTTILVVEDEEALRELTVRILRRNGFHAVAAAGGPEALKIADDPHQRIDLLLSDVVMPHINGAELAEQLHQVRPGLKVLFMSGYAQPFATGRGVLEPGTVLITKPFTQEELLDRVHEALSTGQPG
jgi:PAS domain S-box-containing protein